MFVNLKTFVIFAHDYKRKNLFFVSKISAKLIKTFKMEENIKKIYPRASRKDWPKSTAPAPPPSIPDAWPRRAKSAPPPRPRATAWHPTTAK